MQLTISKIKSKAKRYKSNMKAILNDIKRSCVKEVQEMKFIMEVKKIKNSISNEQLSQYFKDYVESMQCKERHTDIACDEADAYDSMISSIFPNDIRIQTMLYDKMMDVSVEYEESGFIAGYRMCLEHMKSSIA